LRNALLSHFRLSRKFLKLIGMEDGAKNIPWSHAVNDNDGTFKSVDKLKKIYESNGITPDKEVVAYCRIGERSSHTWFVLKYLLGYPNVRNYDGSWTEWGNMINNPIEK
jgi:thiosulfate/3-mercaptopyruvate sulfurtransferase